MTEVTPVSSSSSGESETSFLYLLMDAINLSIETQTKMQLASSITTSQTSDSFNRLVEEGNKHLSGIADDMTQDGLSDREFQELQTAYSQASQEQAGKETLMTSALEVTQQTTAQYSNTIQQLVQTGGAVTGIATSIAQMLERGYS